MGEFRPPTFRGYAECLDRNPWKVYTERGESLRVVSYSHDNEGWVKKHNRCGLLATVVSPYEYSYELWDKWTNKFYPDLLDNGTLGAWLELLPQPVSVLCCKHGARIEWAAEEPRVHRSEEMGRYCLSVMQRFTEVTAPSWRLARAEAFVQAWEKMARNEPTDRYESVIKAEQEERKRRERIKT